VQLLRKVQLQIAVNEDFVEPTVNAIMEPAAPDRRAASATARFSSFLGRLHPHPHRRTGPSHLTERWNT